MQMSDKLRENLVQVMVHPVRGSIMFGGHFAGMIWVHLSLYSEKVTTNQYTDDCIDPMIKHLYPDRSGLFQVEARGH